MGWRVAARIEDVSIMFLMFPGSESVERGASILQKRTTGHL